MRQIILNRKKIFFFIFGPDKDWPWSYVFSFKVRNQGYIVLEKNDLEIYLENDLIFLEVNLTRTGLTLTYLTVENQGSRSS